MRRLNTELYPALNKEIYQRILLTGNGDVPGAIQNMVLDHIDKNGTSALSKLKSRTADTVVEKRMPVTLEAYTREWPQRRKSDIRFYLLSDANKFNVICSSRNKHCKEKLIKVIGHEKKCSSNFRALEPIIPMSISRIRYYFDHIISVDYIKRRITFLHRVIPWVLHFPPHTNRQTELWRVLEGVSKSLW